MKTMTRGISLLLSLVILLSLVMTAVACGKTEQPDDTVATTTAATGDTTTTASTEATTTAPEVDPYEP